MTKCVSFFGVSGLQGLCGRGGLVTRPNPAQITSAAQLALQSFSSLMCTGCWARNPVRCEEVVSL